MKNENTNRQEGIVVLVCGGRGYKNWENVFKNLDEIHARRKIKMIINGKSRGADLLSSSWAKLNKIEPKEYPAMWNEFGLSAGPIRNSRMISENHIDLVVAFPGGTGTADMVKKSREHGIEVIEVC